MCSLVCNKGIGYYFDLNVIFLPQKHFPVVVQIGKILRYIQAACNNFMVEKIDGFFVKDLLNSLKI